MCQLISDSALSGGHISEDFKKYIHIYFHSRYFYCSGCLRSWMRKPEYANCIEIPYFWYLPVKLYCSFKLELWKHACLSCLLILLWFHTHVRVLLRLQYLNLVENEIAESLKPYFNFNPDRSLSFWDPLMKSPALFQCILRCGHLKSLIKDDI